MNIIEAIKDQNLFRPFLGEDLSSWMPWLTALRVVHGIHPIEGTKGRDLIRVCSGRDPDQLPPNGFDTALFLTGRRSGKSRIAAVCGAFEAALSGREKRLAKGEIGMVAIISPTKSQSSIVKSYLRSIFDTPLLAREVVAEQRDGFDLRNGVRVQIMSGDWKSVRGFSLIGLIIDELCFFGLDEESQVKNDTELVRALLPSLATTGGRMIGISSPYTPSGWAHAQWKRHFGNNATNTLVWMAPSRSMNPTLSQKVVDAAMEEDPEGASAEYGAQWRVPLSALVSRDVVESLVKRGRRELLPQKRREYHGGCDMSSGRAGGDDAALAISHLEEGKVVIDLLKVYSPPFQPYHVMADMSRILERYDIRQATGDNYSAEFVTAGFRDQGIIYNKCDRNKSQVYLELLPRLCSGDQGLELLDDPIIVNQLLKLERKTRSGGRDVVDHQRGCKDDAINAIAIAAYIAAESANVVEVGGWR